MLNRIFLMSLLLAPAASWAACTSHKVGPLTLDCTAAGHELNNPATSGISLQTQPDKNKPGRPATIRVVRPHETFDVGGPAGGAAGGAPGGAGAGPGARGAGEPAGGGAGGPK